MGHNLSQRPLPVPPALPVKQTGSNIFFTGKKIFKTM